MITISQIAANLDLGQKKGNFGKCIVYDMYQLFHKKENTQSTNIFG